MKISMHQASAPRFANALRNLSAILDKAQAHAEAKKLDPALLGGLRLIADMFPLARQVQRYVLLTTLARYDSSLTPQPYLARRWEWSGDRRRLTFHLETTVRWHDGPLTTARDVVWTLSAARDPATG